MQTNNDLLKSISASKENINGAAGNLSPDVIPILKFFYNSAVPTATEIDIWTPGGVKVDLSASERMVITSTDALNIIVSGVDNDYNLLTETVSSDGVNPITTVGSFLAIYRAQISEDSALINSGVIDITAETSLTLQARIDANLGQTQMSHFVVPAGYTAMIDGLLVLTSRNDDAIVALKESSEGGAYISKIPIEISDATPEISFERNPVAIGEKTWIKISGIAETNATRISSHYRMMLYKNEYLAN